jgi:hypothetical protein
VTGLTITGTNAKKIAVTAASTTISSTAPWTETITLNGAGDPTSGWTGGTLTMSGSVKSSANASLAACQQANSNCSPAPAGSF